MKIKVLKSILKCCNTENRFSHEIFVPHSLRNKIISSVENICSPNSEINDRIRIDNDVFSFGIKKKKIINKIHLTQKYKSTHLWYTIQTRHDSRTLYSQIQINSHSKLVCVLILEYPIKRPITFLINFIN